MVKKRTQYGAYDDVLYICLPKELKEKVKEMAYASKNSMSDFVRKLLEAILVGQFKTEVSHKNKPKAPKRPLEES